MDTEPYRDSNPFFVGGKIKSAGVLACRNNVVLLDRRNVESGELKYDNGPWKWAVYDASNTKYFGEWRGFKTRVAAIKYFISLSGQRPKFVDNNWIFDTVAYKEYCRVRDLLHEDTTVPSEYDTHWCSIRRY